MLVTLGLTGAPSTSSAEEPPSSAAGSYAIDNGVSAERAALAVDDQAVVNELLTELGGAHIADVWSSPSGSGQEFFVRTTDAALAKKFTSAKLSRESSIQHIDAAPLDLVVTDGDEARVRTMVPGVQGMYVAVEDGTLVVETTDAATKSLALEIQKSTGYSKVRLDHLVDAGADSLTVRGGTAMSNCTAGFTATRGSEKGFLSAAHCPNTQSLYGGVSASGTSTSATETATVHGANSDIGFFKVGSSNTLSSSFYGASSTNPTSYAGMQDVAVGTNICHRGKTEGWRCGSLTSITYKPTWSNACNGVTCNSVFGRVSAIQSGGDSGGPWVNGRYAVGIHKGGGSGWSVYSKLYSGYRPSGTNLY